MFAVHFDQNLWEYGNDHWLGATLFHRQQPECRLVLHGLGEIGTEKEEDTILLAGRDWTVFDQPEEGKYWDIWYASPPFDFPVAIAENASPAQRSFCQRAAEDVIDTFVPPPADTPPTTQIIGGSQANDEPWLTAYSQRGGFSFRHPTSWSVTEHEIGGIFLSPPAGQQQDGIWLGYMTYEKPEDADLQTWMKKYLTLGMEPRSPSRFSTDPALPSLPVTLQRLYIEDDPPLLRREYLITNGRLVLRIVHHSIRAGQDEVLRRVADSIAFDAAAPANLTELYYPEPPETSTGYLTIEAYQQWMNDSNVALEALNFRSQTGEEPTALLATMSERARAEYERLVLNAADHIKIMDRQRAFQTALSPLPTPAPSQLSAAGEMNRVRYQSAGDDGRERFEIRFDPNLWEFADTPAYGHHLIHHHLIDCTLVLRDWDDVAIDGRGTFPLADRGWTVFLAASGNVLFQSPPYSFFLSGNDQASPLENPHCLQAAKEVINTVTVLSADAAAPAQISSDSSALDEP